MPAGTVTDPDRQRAALDEPGRSLRRWTLVGVVATAIIVGGAVAGGRSFVSEMPGAWFFGTPGGPVGSLAAAGRQPPAAATLAVYGGIILLIRAWFGLYRTAARHPGLPVRRILIVIAIWAIPLLIGPPLFSRDLYTYAGQGELVSRHIDPYFFGTGVLGATPFSTLPGPLWANTPSPYGPVFLTLDRIAIDLSGHHVLANLLLLRLLEIGGLALCALSIPVIARSWHRDPAAAVALGVGSPLALTTLLGGGHNDALMVGLLLAGLAVARRGHPAPGIVLCALATGIKAPAVLGVLFLGWNWAGPGSRLWTRVGRTLAATGLAAATLGIVSELSGIGWGWLHTLAGPSKVSTGVTPVDTVARVVADVTSFVHLPLPLNGTRTAFGLLGLLAAGLVAAWMLLRSPEIGTERALGISLLVLAFLGPILWPWYLMWGLLVLAPVASGGLRRAVVVITVIETLIGASSVSGMVHSYLHLGILNDVLVVAGLAAVLLLPLRPSARATGRVTEQLRTVAGHPSLPSSS